VREVARPALGVVAREDRDVRDLLERAAPRLARLHLDEVEAVRLAREHELAEPAHHCRALAPGPRGPGGLRGTGALDGAGDVVGGGHGDRGEGCAREREDRAVHARLVAGDEAAREGGHDVRLEDVRRGRVLGVDQAVQRGAVAVPGTGCAGGARHGDRLRAPGDRAPTGSSQVVSTGRNPCRAQNGADNGLRTPWWSSTTAPGPSRSRTRASAASTSAPPTPPPRDPSVTWRSTR